MGWLFSYSRPPLGMPPLIQAPNRSRSSLVISVLFANGIARLVQIGEDLRTIFYVGLRPSRDALHLVPHQSRGLSAAPHDRRHNVFAPREQPAHWDLCVLTTTLLAHNLPNKGSQNTIEVGHCHIKALPVRPAFSC